MTSELLTGTPEVPTPAGGEFVVAILVGDGLLLDQGTGRLPRVTGVDWPDHRQRTLGHTSAVPIAPLAKVAGETETWVFPMALRKPAGVGPTCPLPELDRLDEGPDVVAAVRTAVGQWRGDLPFPDRRPEWFRPGWWDEVEAWLEDRILALGRRRTGPLRTVKFWSLSAILEVPTSGGATYLKATCRWFRQEAAITRVVRKLAPDVAPGLLAADVSRAWMLLDPLPGDPDRWPRPAGTAAAAARALADLQLRSVEHLGELARAGCTDRGEEATIRAFGQVLRSGSETEGLEPAEREALLELEPRLADTVRRLYRCGLPVVLSHGDLHLGNVASDGEQLVFYDWTDACLSHPFLDAAHLAESVAQETSQDADEVWSSYLPAWREAVPGADLGLARRLAPVVNLMFQAVSYEGILRAAQETAAAHEMGGEQQRLLRAVLRAAGVGLDSPGAD